MTKELKDRLPWFTPTISYADHAEIDSEHQLICVYQIETAFRRAEPLVMRLDEFLNYQLWEDGMARSRQELGNAYTGELMPNGKILGGRNAIPGQCTRKPYIYKRYLVLFFSYQATEIPVCLDLISLRIQVESVGYRNAMKTLNQFLDFLDDLRIKNCKQGSEVP